jgi:hypothetical protein
MDRGGIPMLRSTAALALLLASSATAQSISYRTNNPAPIKGDPNKIVCEREEKIGTRLGGKKVCLTVAEWQMRQQADRESAERLQAGTRAPCYEGCGPDLNFGDIGSPR